MIKKYLKFSIECGYDQYGSKSTINIRNLEYDQLLKISEHIPTVCLKTAKINYTTNNLIEYIVQTIYPHAKETWFEAIKDQLKHFEFLFSNKKDKSIDQIRKEAINNPPKMYREMKDAFSEIVDTFIKCWLPCLKIAEQIQINGTIDIDLTAQPFYEFENALFDSLKELISNLTQIIKKQIEILKD